MSGRLLALLLLWHSNAHPAESLTAIHFAGLPAELAIHEVSARTLRVTVSPLNEQGRASSGPPSAVLERFPQKEWFRTRELRGQKKLRVGDLRLTITPQPLSISVHRRDGKLVQELVFGGSGATSWVAFHTRGPVLGLGEGANQFDRRGHFYPMVNGQTFPFLATHGATIPVPFLIGTDGWALFAYQPWGQFDLREGKGLFLTTKDTAGHGPLDLFVSVLNEPADALAEFIRLTGRPVMPPKWTMGYNQSHRTLLGPDDALNIARTFRQKQLPCDALIYLAYRDGTDARMVWIQFRCDNSARRLRVALDPRSRHWRGASREFTVEVSGIRQPQPIEFRGKPVELKL